MAALGSQKAVLFAEPNYIARAFTIPNDPEWKTQESYLQNIQMPQAWDLPAGQVDAMIAVIDTGIDASHPELASKIWINPGELGEDGTGRNKNSNGKDDDNNGYIDDWQGSNATSNNGDIHDSNGHGTHIAGIAIASANNNLGIAGIAWGSHVMVLKALDDSGEGGYAQVAKAIIYAASQGASVINLSLGNSSYSTLLDMAVEHARPRRLGRPVLHIRRSSSASRPCRAAPELTSGKSGQGRISTERRYASSGEIRP